MAQDLSSRRALIVDDEFLIAFDLEASMHELGFDVCNVASNEKDAKALAMSNRPDVVVMDVYLGGARTGIETARWLKEVCDVPIVFVTAHSDDGNVTHFFEPSRGFNSGTSSAEIYIHYHHVRRIAHRQLLSGLFV